MKILAKNGNQVNVATKEFYCDTIADMKEIAPKDIVLGTTCLVLEGASGAVEIYVANSQKQWLLISTIDATPLE